MTTPTRAELVTEGQAAIYSERPDLSTSLDTLVGAMLQAVVDLTRGIYIAVENGEKNIFVTTVMDTATLEKHAEVWLGPSARKAATKSRGTDAIRVTGTLAGAAVAVGQTLVHTDGTRYQTIESGIAGVGTADLSVESISTGIQVNKLTGEKLRFESAPPNIEEEVTIVADLSGGYDQESNAELQARVLHALRNPLGGGRFSDYKRWSEEEEGVAQAFVYGPSSAAPSGRRGVGVVDLVVLAPGTGASRIPSAALVQAVQDVIDAQRPDTTLDTAVLLPGTQSQDIDVRITPAPGYDWDWTGAGETVAGWDGASGEIELSAANATLQAAIAAEGSARVYVAGQLLVADQYSPGTGPVGGGDEIHLTTTPSPAPAAPDNLYPGGPVSAGVRAAVVEYMDSLGPARGLAADPGQDWDDTLRISKLLASTVHRRYEDGTTSGVAGVQDAEVIDPPANVTPTDHAPSGTVDLLLPGTITIRPS